MNHSIASRFTRPVLASLLLICSAASVLAQLPAFPGAQGFGRFSTGGRGGSVYHVTTLADSGPGSFRDAVSVANRTIVFDIGGVIDYQAPRYAPKANITIAGQTAPGDGITIYGNGLSFSGANNNICRFIRVRQGINGDSGTDAMGIANGNTMIFDHITSSWGRDETFSISGSITNITIQSSIISQGLQGHSAGGLIQTDGGVSILRSLYIDNDTRNPKVKGVNEYVNNVVCNWETIGYNMGGDSAGESFVNVFNNYFMRGQASGSTAIGGGNTDFHIYATNNFYDGDRDGILDGTALPFANYGSMDLLSTPFAYPITPASAYSALTALKLAISDAGPSFKRDSVDELMMTQLTSWGLLGGTITSELIAPMSGPGVVRNGTPYTDTDQDGMPNFWESGTGSNPAVTDNNAASPSGSGYTRLEDYLNWLAEPHGIALQNTNVVIDLRQFTRGWVVVNHSPFWSVSNPTNGTVTLTNGYMAIFTPTTGLNSNASFAFTVNDTDGSPVTRVMNLFFTPSAQTYKAIWHGDDLANNWNTLGDFNWHDGISLLYQFHAGESVTFDDSGSTNPAVNLVGSLTPASVTINATKSFALSGNGSLDGSMALNKTNTGTLTLNNTNGFTGSTTVSNGTLLVHGALNASAVTVCSNGTIGGNGRLGNSLTALSGSTLAPGNGIGSPGTLTITNALTLSGGVTNRFDLSDDPTGTTKTNDVIRVFGNLNLSGVNALKFTLLDGLPGNGVYTLITYSGALSGSLANFSLSGISGTLTNPPGAIAIIVNASRPPATLAWTGNGGNNFWDTGTNVCWLNDIIADKFYFGDDVVFDNTGSTNLTATLVGELTPASVTVDSTASYTLTGAGKITGTGGLTKTNSGTLTILTTNDFTGPTVIGSGTLSVSRLANGGAASGIGAASSNVTDLVFSNSKLSYTGSSVSTDRGATFNGSANFDITSGGTALTWNGVLVGGGSLIKSGAGQLILSGENTFSSGTIVSNGTLALNGPTGGGTITANNYSLGSGSVTFQGGTLKLFGHAISTGPDYGTFSRPMIVPAGQTGTLLTPPRYTMSASLSGAGTLNLEVDYLRGTLSGNWSAFTGLINVTGRVVDSEFRVNSTAGYAGATLFLNNNVVITRNGGTATINIGALGGTSGSRIGPGSSTSGGSSYSIGWNNLDATFAGQILADGVNTITKVGTGNWTISGASTYSGGTIVDGGTLTVNNTSGSGTGSGVVTVNTGATLAGTGIISGAVTINSGATVTPGNGNIGTLTVNNAVTLAAGSTTRIEINKTSLAKDLLDSSATLTYGGSLIVTNLSGTLANGDSFKIFDAGTYAGSFTTTNLPALAPDLMWNTSSLNTSGAISVVSTNFTGPQPLLWKGDGGANLWDGGTLNWLTTNAIPRAFANGDSVTFDNTGFNSPAINLTATFSPASLTVNASANYTFSGVGALTGTMPLTKSGTGTLTLANTGGNSYSGVTTINAGALQLGDGMSVTVNQNGNITDNGTLIFANPDPLTNSANISGTGALTKNSVGALTMTGAKTYSGVTTLNAGTLQFNGTPPPGNIVNNTALTLVPSTSLTYVGIISGPGALTFNAAGQTLTLSGASTFSGGLTNTAGNLILAHNNAAGTGPVLYTAGTVMVSGGVVITNNYTIPGATSIDLCMQATNGTGIWAGNVVNLQSSAQWRPGADTGGTLIFTGNALLGTRNFIVPRGSVQFASNAVVSATGTATAFGRDTSGGNRSANVTIKDNAVITLGVCNLGGAQAGNNVTLTIQDNAALNCGANNFDLNNVNRTTAITFLRLNGGTMTVGGFIKTKTAQTNVIQFNGGVLKAGVANASFLPAFGVSSNWVQAGGAKIDDGGFAITIAAPLIHDPAMGGTVDGGLTKSGVGTLTLLDNVNTYTGPTLVLQGQLALSSLAAVATISSSTNLNVAAGATFNTGGTTFTLGIGRKLWGNGTVIGNFVLGTGAILEPGTNAIGKLTFNNALTLAAGITNRFELNKTSLTNDTARVLGNVALGGTLIVTNLSGTLAVGDSFKLFDATSYSGSFTTVILPTLNAGLVWTNQLSTTGIIAVLSTAPANPPVFSSTSLVGSGLTLSGSNGAPNASYYVLTSTNVTLPMTNWQRLLTNQFDDAGNFNFTNAINPLTPQLFYRLQLP